MTILLTHDQQETLKALGNHIITKQGQRWYYTPYWFRDMGNGLFEQVPFESIPDELKDFILTTRGIKIS